MPMNEQDQQGVPWPEVERVNALKTGPAVFAANIQIIRAGTGKVEHYLLTGTTEDSAQPVLTEPKEAT